MKVHLLNQKPGRFLGFFRIYTLSTFLLVLMIGLKSPLWAEGSKDFVNYPGNRMFLDTREDQQLKVYANEGETINVGSSHIGIQGGFIVVINPMGDTIITFNNTGPTSGLGIINNNVEEADGPTGGGTTNGNGYEPGTVVVPADMGGVWTVIFDYPAYVNTSFTNILNNAPWTRAFDQPNTTRVILAWDITVTQGGAGNEGGSQLTGRVFSNEHVSIMQGFDVSSSPTFYVLTKDGYLYQVDMSEAFPYRFPISSNSLGLVNGDGVPIYKSKPESDFTRSADPGTWDPNSFYLYEPQAEDNGAFINNKIFFNPPNADLPASATVTDIFRSNTHTTWLQSGFQGGVVDTMYFSTSPCNDGILEFQSGGYFFVNTNLSGVFNIQIDIDDNGVYTDPVDVNLVGTIDGGLDSLFWDGNDGFGNPIPVQDDFNLNFTGDVRFGEIHIALTDVEGNTGGVTFSWLNAPAGVPNDQFLYDNSDIDTNAGNVSGGGTPGNALPTNIPYTYPSNDGNDDYIDQWSLEEISQEQTVILDVVLDCVCDPEDIPEIAITASDVCEGDALTLSAANSNFSPTITAIDYTWTGPNNYMFSDTGIAPSGSSVANVTNSATAANSGTYQVIATTQSFCSDTVDVQVQVTENPVLQTNEPNVSTCQGGDVQLCATNVTQGLGQMTCDWSGPNGFIETSTVNANDQICLDLTNVGPTLIGDYTVVCSANGCSSNSLVFNVSVEPNPEINGASPNGSFCVGTDVVLTASNNVTGTGPITYTWTGPNFTFTDVTNDETGPFSATIPNIQPADAGDYTLVLTTQSGCASSPQTITIGVDPLPAVCNVTGGGDVCVGQDVVLSGFNCATGLSGTINFEWTDPAGMTICSGNLGTDGPFVCEIIDIQASASGQYCLTLTDAGTNCESDQLCVDVNVLPSINIENVTPDGSFCGGTDVVLSATTTFGGDVTYTWTGPGVTAACTGVLVSSGTPLSCTISDLSAASAGNYTLTVTSASGCVSDPVTVMIGLLDGVTITDVSGGGSYCSGDDLMLSGSASSTSGSVNYVWTDPVGNVVGMGNTSPAGPFDATVANPIIGTYTLTVSSDPDDCSDTETVEVTAGELPIPNITNSGSDTTLCDADSLILCAQNTNVAIGDFTYTWTTPNGQTITGSGNGTTEFCEELDPLSTYGEGDYTLIICDGNCCSDPVTYTISLNATPIISTLSGGGTYCEGDTAIVCFTNINPEVTNWFYTCNIDTTQVTATGTGMDEVCIEITTSTFIFCSLESLEGCVSDLEGTQVIFDPNYTPDLDVDTIVCANDTLELNGTNPSNCTGTVTYTWTGPDGFTFTGTADCNGPFPAVDPSPMSGEYCLDLDAGGNTDCSEQVCINVTVNDLPFVVGGNINGGGTDFCVGDDIELTATIENPSGGDISYEWTQDGTVVGTGTAMSGDMISLDLSPADTSDNGNYCLNLTCIDTGCSDEGLGCTDVIVNETPVIDSISGSGIYCQGFDVMLNAFGPDGPGTVSYTWTGPNGFSFTGSAPCGGPYPATVNDVDSLDAGVYSIVVTKGVCESDSASAIIEVNPTPDIINVSSGGAECAGAMIPISFTIDPDGADSVCWTITGPGLDTTGIVLTLTEFVFDIIVNGDATYTVTAVSKKGCEADPATITITEIMVPVPVITVESNEPPCPGEPLTLCTDQVANATYSWCLDSVEIAPASSDPCITIDDPQEGTYTVKIMVDGCSEESAPYDLTFPAPPVAVDDNYTTLAGFPVGGNIIENDDPMDGVTITILTEPTNGTVTVDENGEMVYTPNPGFAGTDTYTYEICSVTCVNNCDQAVVTIIVELPPCDIPNVITPDGDNINDILIIDCAPVYPNNRLRIFNRWGDEINVFEPYENSWDGTIGSSKDPVPAGTYFYMFQQDKSNEECQTGYVKVVR